jgi:hypothetical protein
MKQKRKKKEKYEEHLNRTPSKKLLETPNPAQPKEQTNPHPNTHTHKA